MKQMKMENYKYEMIIYWSKEEDALIVEVPELVGCMAYGQSYQKAVETAKELGRPIPIPKGKLKYA